MLRVDKIFAAPRSTHNKPVFPEPPLVPQVHLAPSIVSSPYQLAPAAGYRPPAGSDAAAESSAEAGKLVQALLPALGVSSGGAELLAVDAAAAQRLQLLQPWFWGSRRDATHDGMYC